MQTEHTEEKDLRNCDLNVTEPPPLPSFPSSHMNTMDRGDVERNGQKFDQIGFPIGIASLDEYEH